MQLTKDTGMRLPQKLPSSYNRVACLYNTNQNTFNFNDSCYARKVLPIQGQQRHKLAIVWKHASYAQSRGRRIQCLMSIALVIKQ